MNVYCSLKLVNFEERGRTVRGRGAGERFEDEMLLALNMEEGATS
jgi:hypothetical protein